MKEIKRKHPPAKSGKVYILKVLNKPIYKIGYSTNVMARLRCIQSCCYDIVTIYAIKETNNHITVEEDIKTLLEPYQRHGEWFDLSADMVNDIILSFGFEKQETPLLPQRKPQAVRRQFNTIGLIYVVKVVEGDKCYYKIGNTTNPKSRLSSIQSNCHEKIELIATKKSSLYVFVESAIKKELQDYNVGGKWYGMTSATIEDLLDKYHFKRIVSKEITANEKNILSKERLF